MNSRFFRMLTLAGILAVMTAIIGTEYAEARVGGGRSMGSRGSRSFSTPGQSTYQSPARPAMPAYQQTPFSQPQSGGFLRSMAGGVVGGLLGGMLFRGLGFGGGGGMGGSGIGLFEIILLAGIGFLIYRFISSRRKSETAYPDYTTPSQSSPVSYPSSSGSSPVNLQDPVADLDQGVAHIQQMDASFNRERFCENAMDIFFKIQGAWMNRDLTPVKNLLTTEMNQILQADVDQLLHDRRVNRLENIAVRNVDIVEAWQESGEDYLMVLITANLLDYTTDDATGQIVSGSKTDPVKFQEFWTFRRQVGPNAWQLTAIDQK